MIFNDRSFEQQNSLKYFSYHTREKKTNKQTNRISYGIIRKIKKKKKQTQVNSQQLHLCDNNGEKTTTTNSPSK